MEILTIKHLAHVMPGLLSGNVRIWHKDYPKVTWFYDSASGEFAVWGMNLENGESDQLEISDCYLVGKGWEDLVKEVRENEWDNSLIGLGDIWNEETGSQWANSVKRATVVHDFEVPCAVDFNILSNYAGSGTTKAISEIGEDMAIDRYSNNYGPRAAMHLIEAGYNPGIVPGHLWKRESEVKTETA